MLDTSWVKLSEWARRRGVPYRIAWRMARDGNLPDGVQARQLPTGTWWVREEESQLDRIERKIDLLLGAAGAKA